MKCFVFFTVLVFASKNENVAVNSGKNIIENSVEDSIVVKIEEDEYVKKRSSKFIGVTYDEHVGKWRAQRWSKNEKKISKSIWYKYEETAAHASDILAKKLLENGEQGHKLNFPDDKTEEYPEEKRSLEFIGVYINKKNKRWSAKRWSKADKKSVTNGDHIDKETAARASDTLARQLIANGEQDHKLNFPDDNTDVYAEKAGSSRYIGVSYYEKSKRWYAQRHSKSENKTVTNGSYKDEERAAHASDILARKLMANGEEHHKFNFPDDRTDDYTKHQKDKRKRSFDFEYFQTDQNNLGKFEEN